MTDLLLLLGFWAAFLLALVSPGPNFAVILATSLREGRGPAARTAIGMGMGEAVWGFAAVFGIAALAAAHPWIATLLRWMGGAFLLWLAWGSIASSLRPSSAPEPAEPALPRGRSVLRGFGLMLLNPKAGVFWVSLTSVFLAAGTATATAVLAVCGAVLLSLAWHLALAVVLSGERVRRGYHRVRRGLEASLGAVLAGLGLKLLTAP